MLGWLTSVVLAARAYGVAVIDGFYADFNNRDGFAFECAQTRMLGMDGKSLIHPNQVDACNATFTPSAEELGWARSIVTAFESDGGNRDIAALGGRTVEKLHLRLARRMIATARIAEEHARIASADGVGSGES